MTKTNGITINEKKIIPGQVCETLFMPVIARALESKKAKPLLIDPFAEEIYHNADLDLQKLTSTIPELCQVAWISKYVCFDRLIRDFLRRFPDSTVVNMGCGLDTTYERVNNGSVLWYDLDLPEVIELRKSFIKEASNRKHISASFLQTTWHKEIVFNKNILFVASGVFYYYEEKVIKKFLTNLSLLYPSCELIFDATSCKGIHMPVKSLKELHFDRTLVLKWALTDVKSILLWNPRFRILGKYYTFRHNKISLSLVNRILVWISDILGIQYILHLKIRFDYKHMKLI